MDYHELLRSAKADPKNADFTALRMAYATSEFYSPYDFNQDERSALWEAIQKEDMAQLAHLAEGLIEENFLDLEGHLLAYLAYESLGNEEKASYYKDCVQGFLDSILASGDGRTPQTAFVVINVNEEYALLMAMGFTPQRQQLIKSGDDICDVVIFETPEGQMGQMFFNVNIPHKWLEEHTSEEK